MLGQRFARGGTLRTVLAVAGTIALAVGVGGRAGAVPAHPLPADVDADGRSELVVGAPGEYDEYDPTEEQVGLLQTFDGAETGTVTGNHYDWFYRGPWVSGDFNGDGYADLADESGETQVFYGPALDAYGASNLAPERQWNEWGGGALAAGNYDGDTYDDLAVQRVDAQQAPGGAVAVFRGWRLGIAWSPAAPYYTQATPGLPGDVNENDDFGGALAFGDFDGNGLDDLAIGVPGDTVNGRVGAGSLHVLPTEGRPSGSLAPDAANSQFWTQDSRGMASTTRAGDHFAATLVAADFNGDGFDDLAIGVPGEKLGTYDGAGAVHVLYGSAGGLRSTGASFWTQNSTGIADTVEANDHFGSVLAAGDVNRDGRADLAIGVPDEDLGTRADAGVVHVLLGSAKGITATGSQRWSQDSSGIRDVAEAGDRFGTTLTFGDVDGDGRFDLTIGVPYEDLGSDLRDAGAAHELYGSATGLRAARSQFWTQASPGVGDEPTFDDRFGG